jgi:hypothetical protein
VEEDEAREKYGALRIAGEACGGCGSMWREGGSVREGECWAASGAPRKRDQRATRGREEDKDKKLDRELSTWFFAK